MTTGEIIQLHRKRLNLSQEELGQKLLVSRQTISQWETSQTVPTIDNLVRLKEIFSVSVDELLGCADNKVENKAVESKASNEPTVWECYVFSFSKDEITKIQKNKITTYNNKFILAIFFSILLSVYIIGLNTLGGLIGFCVGIIFTIIVRHFKYRAMIKKNLKEAVERIPQCVYTYKVFDHHFTLEIGKNGETVRTQKFYFNDIEQITDCHTHLELLINGQLYLLKKQTLAPNSVFYRYMRDYPKKAKFENTCDGWQLVSILLFTVAIITIFLGFIIISILDKNGGANPDCMWIFYTLTPIPIASIVYGFILKRKGYKYLKNIVVGFITLGLLCAFGSFTFIFANIGQKNDELITKVEQITDIDVPQYESIVTQDWTTGTQTFSQRYIYSTSTLIFDKANAKLFEERIKDDDRWLTTVPNELHGLTSNVYNPPDYTLIYNVDTDEYNSSPEKSDSYLFINLFYDADSNQLKIVEYNLDYVK